MPIEASRYISERVIFSRAYGNLTLDDFQQANDHWLEILNAVKEGTIHSLIDASQIDNYPNNVFQLAKSQTYFRHPNLGWVVVYGMNNAAMNFVGSTLTQILRAQVRIFKSRAEAIAFLQKFDSTLMEDKDGI